MDLHVACAGLAQGARPEPCVMVIFGATGDLARTTLVPALFGLRQRDLLPERFAIIGVGRRPWSDDEFRKQMAKFNKAGSAWDDFALHLHYVALNFDDADKGSFTPLRQRIEQLQRDQQLPGNILYHFSTAPDFYADIAKKLAAVDLLRGADAWRRVVIEKPFGTDEKSARDLDGELLQVLDEEQIYRIDHFLGKETVQNMLIFRFANPSFEPIWNHQYIDNVQITAAELEGIGTRAGYYDNAGVIRDMIQNHLLQLLCMTAMEPPVAYDAASLRDETTKVLRSIRLTKPTEDWVVGQYGRGDGPEATAYRDEDGVAADSRTPTYAAARLYLDNWRWAGVPFYLRSGKRLARKVTTICIHFKPTPHLMFAVDPSGLQTNVLTFRVQPDEGIVYTFLAKQPGPNICLQPVTMTFRYDAAFKIDRSPSAYEWLLHDAMLGDQTLFARSDWIYKAWSIVDPAIDWWQKETKEIPMYASGTWGPDQADQLLAQDGRTWRCAQ